MAAGAAFDAVNSREVRISVIGNQQQIVVKTQEGGWVDVHDGFIIYQEVEGGAVKMLPMHRVERQVTYLMEND